MNRAILKQEAKTHMAKAHPHVMLVTLVYMIIPFVFNWLTNIPAQSIDPSAAQDGLLYYGSMFQNYIMPTSWLIFGLSFVVGVLLSIVEYGYTYSYCLKVSREQPASFGAIFDLVSRAGKCILIGLVMSIISSLPVIPGLVFQMLEFSAFGSIISIIGWIISIWLSLGFSQAVFVMIDNPDIGVMACLRESLSLMSGNRMQYFVLQLSFLPWVFACLLIIPVFWVTPYMSVTFAGYYRYLIGDTGRAAQRDEEPSPYDDQNMWRP